MARPAPGPDKRFVLVPGATHHNANDVGMPLVREAVSELFGVGPHARPVGARPAPPLH